MPQGMQGMAPSTQNNQEEADRLLHERVAWLLATVLAQLPQVARRMPQEYQSLVLVLGPTLLTGAMQWLTKLSPGKLRQFEHSLRQMLQVVGNVDWDSDATWEFIDRLVGEVDRSGPR